MSGKIRLFVEHPLGAGQSVELSREQAHYLFVVMRKPLGTQVLLFNGVDGEWEADVAQASKRGGALVCQRQRDVQRMPPDLWLLFAPVKKDRTELIVEKATEMGVRRILPVITEYTNIARIQRERLQARALEAAEQCGNMFVPEVAEPVKLEKLMANWDIDRMIMNCDEAYAGGGEGPELTQFPRWSDAQQPWAILIGPEGGFSARDRAQVQAREGTVFNMHLGPRILRADTAVVAAMTLWQKQVGDWDDP